MDGSQPINPFLSGNYAPVRSEDDFELTVTGEIPADLAGALYRTGPNPQFDPQGPHHWFMGDGMVHGFFIENGKARYRNRWVRTPKWLAENAAGHALPPVMGRPHDPADGGLANTNILRHAGKLLALEEAHEPFEIDQKTLEPKGYLHTGGRFTAHPKIDPETGEMVWFAYSAGPAPLNPMIDYGVTDASGKVVRRDRFQAPYCSMIHDFLVTRRHAIFPVLPLVGDLQRAMGGMSPFVWDPGKGAFLGVMGRDQSVDEIRWFEAPIAYVFHPMNAWEEGSLIHCDVMEFPSAPLFPNLDGTMSDPSSAVLVRWTIDLDGPTGVIKRTQLDDLGGEFPRLDERYAGLPYRHGYFAALTHGDRALSFDSLAHFDHKTGRRVQHVFAPGDVPSEPMFVPRSADAPEGDGWLLATVYRGGSNTSDLVILDAQDVEAGPIATAHVPRRVPFGFHGNWAGV